jgi:DNA-binding NarL/FixJ family response regulator
MKKTSISLVDDHTVLRNGLAKILAEMDYEIVSETGNGKAFLETLAGGRIPDIVLMDINMPFMDGFSCTSLLKAKYPLVKVLALSMYDNEYSIIRMLQAGARGFVVKDADPLHLQHAIEQVMLTGYHYSEQVTGKVLHSILRDERNDYGAATNLSDRELTFLKLSATEMTYQQIASEMHVSPRTVDGYRDQLFEKLNIKSRVGLVLYAIRHQIIHVS